jgi:hypothetical protein
MEKLHKAAELTANGWEGSFYPRGMQSRDFLSYYASWLRDRQYSCMPLWEFHFTFWVAHRTTSGLPMGVLERLDQDRFPNLLGLEDTFRPQNFR